MQDNLIQNKGNSVEWAGKAEGKRNALESVVR